MQLRCALVVTLTAILVGAVPSADQAAPARAPFRLTADPDGTLRYFIARPEEKSGYREGDGELATWALEEWQRSLGGAVRFERVEREESAAIRVHWLPWSEEAALGRMEPATVGGRSVASVDIRPDEFRFRPTVRRRIIEDPLMRAVVVYYVCLHEVGHALGLTHSDNARDIMWPGGNGGVSLPVYDHYRHRIETRDDIPRVSWLSHDDISRVSTLWRPVTK